MEDEDINITIGWNTRVKKRMSSLVKMISIEPAVFLQTLTWGLQMVINQNLIIEKVCRDLGYTDDVCRDIDNHPMEDNKVQTTVTQLNMVLSMMSAIPSIVLALFIGPWSDKNGRKPVMLLPMFGYLVSGVIWILNVYYETVPAVYLLATGVYSFFGGFTCLLIGMYSYLADITSIRARTTRIGILDIFMVGGIPVGTFLSGYIFKYFGYYGIYGTALVLQTVCILYIAFLITDTRGPSSDYSDPELEMSSSQPSTFKRYISMIDFHQMVDVFRVTFKKREHNFRRVILILIMLMLLNITVFSDGGIMYLYSRKKFKWNEQQYTKFQTCVIVVSAAAAFIVMPLLSFYWKVHDALIGVISTVSKVASLIVISVANDGWILFIGACLGFLSSLASIVIRSMLSKCVNKSDLGKIYSLLGSLEAAVPLLAAPLFTVVYNSTLETFPGAVFLVQASIFAVSGLGFSYVFYLLTRTGQDFSLLVEDNDDYQENIVRDENSLISQ